MKETDVAETITRTHGDNLGRPYRVKVGTADDNLTLVTEYVYDVNKPGYKNLTCPPRGRGGRPVRRRGVRLAGPAG